MVDLKSAQATLDEKQKQLDEVQVILGVGFNYDFNPDLFENPDNFVDYRRSTIKRWLISKCLWKTLKRVGGR